mmetsp:Transcript_46471/g.104448  ORF Transcript_46471/g.104448 Transcript_46471/m.104448 type:complete len:262 (+) Transcript_46471:1597-2382(+)
MSKVTGGLTGGLSNISGPTLDGSTWFFITLLGELRKPDSPCFMSQRTRRMASSSCSFSTPMDGIPLLALVGEAMDLDNELILRTPRCFMSPPHGRLLLKESRCTGGRAGGGTVGGSGCCGSNGEGSVHTLCVALGVPRKPHLSAKDTDACGPLLQVGRLVRPMGSNSILVLDSTSLWQSVWRFSALRVRLLKDGRESPLLHDSASLKLSAPFLKANLSSNVCRGLRPWSSGARLCLGLSSLLKALVVFRLTASFAVICSSC